MSLDLKKLLAHIAAKKPLSGAEAQFLARRLAKLGEIVEASRSLMGAVDMSRLLTEILEKTRGVMHADKASVFLVDNARGEVFASVTLDGSQIRLPLGSGIIGHVAKSGDTVNIPDAYADLRFNAANDHRTGYRTRSILCMPIRNAENAITGAIQILNRLDGEPFSQEDEELLAAFAGMLGVCLENARAYAELACERNSLEEKVVERTFELAVAKAETDQILQAVEEGLFLLYRSGERFLIGAGYSRALTGLFEQEDLRSSDLLVTIGRFVDAQTVQKTRTFLELMFDEGRNAAMLQKLNPLDLIEANFSSGVRKHLRLQFVRVLRDTPAGKQENAARARVGHLLVTVSDATQEIALAERLARTQADNQLRTELIRTILQSDPATLSEFLQDFDTDLESARESVSLAAGGKVAALGELFRILHSVKGNASMLGFSLLASRAHAVEGEIEAYLRHPGSAPLRADRLDGQLRELEELRLEIGAWLGRIEAFHENFTRHSSGDYLQRALASVFTRTLAAEEKRGKLDTSALDATILPGRFRKQIKDLLIQMVRNAAVHGLEAPAVRESAGKPDIGLLRISTCSSGGKILLAVEDDGAGIDADTLAHKLVNQGALSAADYARMPHTERLNLVFAAGVSRLSEATQYAGRGMGMSIVAEALAQMAATVVTQSDPGRFTRFQIEIPVA